jgi:uncharacterized protein involved in exopolysaccharide biosynthesis
VLAGELQVPRYQARTLLQVMPPNPTSLSVTDALVQTGNPMRDRQFFNTEAQDKLLKTYQGQDLFVPEGSVSAITTSITKLNEDHIQAQARRIEFEAQLGEFAEARKRGRGLNAIPHVAKDEAASEINGKIQTLTLELAKLREKYKEGHPEVQKVQAQVQQLRNDRDARAAQIEESLRAEYRQHQRKEAELKAAIDEHKGKAAEQSQKLTEIDSLKKRADSAAGLRGARAEGERDQHRRLAPEQQHPPPRPRGRAHL